MVEVPPELKHFNINIVYCEPEDGRPSWLAERIWQQIKKEMIEENAPRYKAPRTLRLKIKRGLIK